MYCLGEDPNSRQVVRLLGCSVQRSEGHIPTRTNRFLKNSAQQAPYIKPTVQCVDWSYYTMWIADNQGYYWKALLL